MNALQYSAAGVYAVGDPAGAWVDGNYIALDSGCVWGEQMTTARIDQYFIKFYQTGCQHDGSA